MTNIVIIYMWNLNIYIYILIFKAEIHCFETVYFQNRNTLTDIENKVMVIKGGRGNISHKKE